MHKRVKTWSKDYSGLSRMYFYYKWKVDHIIIAAKVMRTRNQSGVHQISKVCKERACVCTVSTRSQNSVTNNKKVKSNLQI